MFLFFIAFVISSVMCQSEPYHAFGFPYITDHNMRLIDNESVEIFGDNTRWFLEKGADG